MTAQLPKSETLVCVHAPPTSSIPWASGVGLAAGFGQPTADVQDSPPALARAVTAGAAVRIGRSRPSAARMDARAPASTVDGSHQPPTDAHPAPTRRTNGADRPSPEAPARERCPRP